MQVNSIKLWLNELANTLFGNQWPFGQNTLFSRAILYSDFSVINTESVKVDLSNEKKIKISFVFMLIVMNMFKKCIST